MPIQAYIILGWFFLFACLLLVGVYNVFLAPSQYRIKEHDGIFYPQMKRGLFEEWKPIMMGDGFQQYHCTINRHLALEAIKKHHKTIQYNARNKPIYHKIDTVTLD